MALPCAHASVNSTHRQRTGPHAAAPGWAEAACWPPPQRLQRPRPPCCSLPAPTLPRARPNGTPAWLPLRDRVCVLNSSVPVLLCCARRTRAHAPATRQVPLPGTNTQSLSGCTHTRANPCCCWHCHCCHCWPQWLGFIALLASSLEHVRLGRWRHMGAPALVRVHARTCKKEAHPAHSSAHAGTPRPAHARPPAPVPCRRGHEEGGPSSMTLPPGPPRRG